MRYFAAFLLMISARTKEEIIAATHIEDVVGEFVNLKKRGSNFIGLCPFHTEKTPSFNVSPSKGIFKCFGCGKSGDAIGFMMEHEKFTYPEALQFLARKYHIAVEETGDAGKEAVEQQLKESLFVITQFAQDYFAEQLLGSEEGQTIGYAYFRERGITDEMIRRFHLGYALKDTAVFTRTALKSGYRPELLRKAGLVTTKGGNDQDFFHHRIIFPIHNLSGKAVAFAGRILVKDEHAPKYINSPETEVYKKSQLVYGIFQARNAIRRQDECFLTEGYTDVISLHMAGMENVVASSGTSLTDDQIKLIRRFTNNITLLYDGDAAGIKAALRGLEMMAAQDVNVRVVLLPDGDDPDSFLHKHGSAALRDFIRDHKKDFLRFKTETLLADAGDDPLKRTEVIRQVVTTLAAIPDVIRRSVLTHESSQWLQINEQVLIAEVNKVKRTQFRKQTGAASFEAEALHAANEVQAGNVQEEFVSDDELQERSIIRLLLEYGSREMNEKTSVAAFVLEEVKDLPLGNPQLRLLLHEIQQQVEAGNIPDHHYFLQHGEGMLKQLVIEIITSPYALSDNWKVMHEIYVTMPDENFRNEVTNTINHFKMKKVKAMMKENLGELRLVQGQADDEKHYLQVHVQLIEWKKQLGEKMGTVITG